MNGRTTTDAVHERMQAAYYTCEPCKTKFKAKDIEKHFTATRFHTSQGKCSYCDGPCYSYIDHMDKPDIWHKCPKP